MIHTPGFDQKAFAAAKQMLLANPTVTSVGIGYRYRGGKKIHERCIVVGVQKKLPRALLINTDIIVPGVVAGFMTDVQDRDVYALGTRILFYQKTGMWVGPRSLVQRRRPCPPGYSVGHHLITAGTIGFYAQGKVDDGLRIVSNNHVLANSNKAQPNDEIRQPGTHDGGTSSDRFGLLEDYVRIKWDGDNDKKDKKSARTAWRIWSAPANWLARIVGCPYRLRTVRAHAIEQPYPNLVDAAVARPVLESYCDLDYPFGIGPLRGIRDLSLGDKVQKVGRTTEHTQGTVEGVAVTVRVSYREGKTATFDDQIEIRAAVGQFSAGGDSGSAILTEDGYLGGLLYAGGSGVTIANRISHVLSLTGVRV